MKKEKTNEVSREIRIIKDDSANITGGTDGLKKATDALVNALVADKLINKDNFTLSLKKAKLSLDGIEQKEEINDKYKLLIDSLHGDHLELNNSKKH